MNKIQKQMKEDARQNALAYLMGNIKKDDRIYALRAWRNRAGDSHAIKLFIARGKEVIDISWAAARVLDVKFNRTHGGVHFGGGGMSPTFGTVYDLAWALFDDGYALSMGDL